MLRPRIIPCLLIHRGGLVKTRLFNDPKYVGDPINAVRIFNEKQADELLILDIDATVSGKPPDFDFISKLAKESRMPLCYGGGVTSVEQVERMIDMGIEKVAVSSAAVINPSIFTSMVRTVGTQSVVAVLDVVKKTNHYDVCTHNSKIRYDKNPILLAQHYQELGVGEILINSVDQDGMMNGYDMILAKSLRESIKIPITFLGGAGSLDDILHLVENVGIVGAAAGSMFVFKGKHRAVLINYPTLTQKEKIATSTSPII